MKPKWTMPREPIVKFLQEEIRKRQPEGYNPNGGPNGGGVNGRDQVIFEIVDYSTRFGPERTFDSVDRYLRKLVAGRDIHRGKEVFLENVSLDYAEQIVCSLRGPMHFYEDPELREFYEQIEEPELSPEASARCPECRRGFVTTNNRKKFCSNTCRITNGSRRFRTRKKEEALAA